MILTSLSALAASVRSTLTWEQSNPDSRKPLAPRKKGASPGTAVDHSQDRAELSADAIELLKSTSVQFHHLPPPARKESTQRQPSSAPVAWAKVAIRRYTSGA